MKDKKKLRVLVADDNDVNQLIIKGMLEHEGIEVDTAYNGQEAIGLLAKDHYDLVILDCMMPVMDGFVTAHTIRASSTSQFDPNIPILAITALATPEDRGRCLDAGMSGHIKKPVIAEDLFEWIRQNLGTRFQSDTDRPVEQPAAGSLASPAIDGVKTDKQPVSFQKLTPLLLRDATLWRQELREHCDANKLVHLGELAHKIRGTADVMGYGGLSEIARRLEKSGKERNASESSVLVGSLIESLNLLIQEIQAEA